MPFLALGKRVYRASGEVSGSPNGFCRMKKAHVAIYGNTPIQRAYCDQCRQYAFVIDGDIQCCGRAYYEKVPEDVIRMSLAEQRRKYPPPWWKKKTIADQKGTCIYCGHRLGLVYLRHGKERTLGVHWDHFDAYSFSQNNSLYNYVAACSLCNLFKGNKSFYSIESARAYLLDRWRVDEIEILYDPPVALS